MQYSSTGRSLLSFALVLACAPADRDDSGLGSSGAVGTGGGDAGSDGESSPTDGDDGGSGGDGDGETDTDTTGAPGTGGDGDGDGEVRLDVGPGGSGGGEAGGCDAGDPDCGCTAVDVLFVVDNSGSMFIHQQRLASVFPRFVDVMVETLPVGTSLHVGITTQGGFWRGSGSGSWSGSCVTDASPYPDGYTPPTVATNGGNGDQGRLYEHEGLHYFEMVTGDDPQPLADWFSTAATVPDAGGGDEDQIELLAPAGAYPFHPANAATNAGFLRDAGAVLLIFYLTDTSDITPESAESLADIVRTAKSVCGGDRCILTGGMVSETANCVAEYPRLMEFLSAFGKPPAALGNIDGPGGGWPPEPAPIEDYEAVLGTALAEVLAQTCEEIPPVG